MCKYTFWKDSIRGLAEEIVVYAINYQDALITVNAYINHQLLKQIV